MLYCRHGQTAVRGPHVALQLIFSTHKLTTNLPQTYHKPFAIKAYVTHYIFAHNIFDKNIYSSSKYCSGILKSF